MSVMSEYGVGILNNRFALLDDEDPFEVLERRQKQKEAKKKSDSLEREKKTKETVSDNGLLAKKKSPPVQKENQKNRDDTKMRYERKSTAFNDSPYDHTEGSSEQIDSGFEQQRNGSFRSNRRSEVTQKSDNRPPMKGGKMFARSGVRSVGGPGSRGFQGRGGNGRPEEDWNKSESASREEQESRRGIVQQHNEKDEDGFSRPDRRNRLQPIGNDSNRFGIRSGSKWRGIKSRPGFEGRNNFQANNSTGRSRSGSEGEERVDDTDVWNTTATSEEGVKTAEEKNNDKNNGIQDQEEEKSEEKAVELNLQELTLDEWKALKKRDGPTYNLRKAGEGEDLTKWKDMIQLDKKKDDAENEESEGEYEICEYPQRVGRQKYIKDLDFKFADRRRSGGPSNRQRNNRTARADTRGFNTRSDISDNSVHDYVNKQAVPKVDDERAFPSLG